MYDVQSFGKANKQSDSDEEDSSEEDEESDEAREISNPQQK